MIDKDFINLVTKELIDRNKKISKIREWQRKPARFLRIIACIALLVIPASLCIWIFSERSKVVQYEMKLTPFHYGDTVPVDNGVGQDSI
ncbi:MAG: hypothetical protein KBS70_04070 [Bacteroidales bacterium]|nr:hypothetical protein [Candidatus Colicola equi]